MKKTIILILIMLSFKAFSQIKVDTIIKTEILESYFSYDCKNPLYIKYKLYQGGGDCNRSQFHFKTGGVENSATSSDYYHSGYDIGHLASAEDFAYDCHLDSLTFFYYNALPQTPNLNRGVWKTWEGKIRNLSQTDSLLIICGGYFPEDCQSLKNEGSVKIPLNCWKIVKSLSTNKIVYVLWFTNELEIRNSVKTGLKVVDIEKRTGLKIDLKYDKPIKKKVK